MRKALKFTAVKRPVSRPKRHRLPRPIEQTAPGTITITTDELAAMLAAGTGAKAPPRFTRIEHHTETQLENAINYAMQNCPGFWNILHGIDAYFEKRARKLRLENVRTKYQRGDLRFPTDY